MTSASTPIAPGAQPFFLHGNETGVLLLHGYGGSIGDYRQFGELLNRRGYTVAGVCLTGHGQGKKILSQATIADWQHSVDEGIRSLHACRRIVVVGSSFGGVLALDVARREPQLVVGLVVVNAALSYKGGGIFQDIVLRSMRLVTPYYPKKGLTNQERERGQQIGSTDAWPINGILATAAFARKVIVPSLGTIDTPIMIVSSSHDPVVSERTSQLLLKRLGSVQKQTLVIPVETHRPFRNEQAVRFLADHVCQFIESLLVD